MRLVGSFGPEDRPTNRSNVSNDSPNLEQAAFPNSGKDPLSFRKSGVCFVLRPQSSIQFDGKKYDTPIRSVSLREVHDLTPEDWKICWPQLATAMIWGTTSEIREFEFFRELSEGRYPLDFEEPGQAQRSPSPRDRYKAVIRELCKTPLGFNLVGILCFRLASWSKERYWTFEVLNELNSGPKEDRTTKWAMLIGKLLQIPEQLQNPPPPSAADFVGNVPLDQPPTSIG